MASAPHRATKTSRLNAGPLPSAIEARIGPLSLICTGLKTLERCACHLSYISHRTQGAGLRHEIAPKPAFLGTVTHAERDNRASCAGRRSLEGLPEPCRVLLGPRWQMRRHMLPSASTPHAPAPRARLPERQPIGEALDEHIDQCKFGQIGAGNPHIPPTAAPRSRAPRAAFNARRQTALVISRVESPRATPAPARPFASPSPALLRDAELARRPTQDLNRFVRHGLQRPSGTRVRSDAGILSGCSFVRGTSANSVVGDCPSAFVHLAKVRIMLKRPRRKLLVRWRRPMTVPRAQPANFLQLPSKKCTTLAGP